MVEIQYLKDLQKKIALLSENEQGELYKLIKKNNCKYTLNNNGVFIILNNLEDSVLKQIENLIDYSRKNKF